jgi:nicotinate phosphoribosyltransferase
MDIVEKEGRPVAKRGKLSGRKFTFRCDRCLNYGISTSKKNPPNCIRCGERMGVAEVKILSKGKRVKKEEPTEAIRDRVIDRTKSLGL